MIYEKRNEGILSQLHPTVAEMGHRWLDALSNIGIEVLLTSGYRSNQEQTKLYAQGRTTPGPIVTFAKAGQSYHNWRLAFDFVPVGPKGEAQWSGDFELPARIAKQIGFEWGGSWGKPKTDKPHLQYTFGLSIQDLQRGKRPPETKTSPSKSFNDSWWHFSPKALARRLARLAKRG